jgi:hypothetical protein
MHETFTACYYSERAKNPGSSRRFLDEETGTSFTAANPSEIIFFRTSRTLNLKRSSVGRASLRAFGRIKTRLLDSALLCLVCLLRCRLRIVAWLTFARRLRGCEGFVILNEVKDPARSSARYQGSSAVRRVQEHARSFATLRMTQKTPASADFKEFISLRGCHFLSFRAKVPAAGILSRRRRTLWAVARNLREAICLENPGNEKKIAPRRSLLCAPRRLVCSLRVQLR